MSERQSALEICNLSAAYLNEPVLLNVDVRVQAGVLMAIVGPNGAGKSTLLKSILGLVQPLSGSIKIFGGTFAGCRDKVAYVPQRTAVDWDFPINVIDVVLMGRYPKIGWFRCPGKADYHAAMDALTLVGMDAFAERHIGQLSGGQQQRVFLARALISDAQLFLMDEPFVGVDLATEKMIVKLLQQLCAQGKTILVVHHDLQTLNEYFNWVLLLNVRRVACGPVEQVLMPEYICAAYGDRNLYVSKE